MLSRNFLSFFSILITTVQGQEGSAAKDIAKLPTSIPLGYDGLGSVFQVFCEDIVYTQRDIMESVTLGCRRTNRKGSKVTNPIVGLVLRAPKIYKPTTAADAFQIPGKPYRMTALDYQRRKRRNTGGTDYTVVNESCQFVGVLTEYKGTRFNPKPRTKKCPMNLILRRLRGAPAPAI